MSSDIKSDGWREVDAVVVEVGDRVTLENGNRLTRFVVDQECDGILYDDYAERYDLTGQQPDWRIVRIEQPAKPDATPAPLDPSKVKAGDTVTLESGTALVRDVVIEAKSRGVGQFVFYTAESPDPLIPGTYYLVNHGAWTLTEHQPAPEPELADERIVAWERVARHPVLSATYDGEGPLIDSVMAVLDRIADQPAPAPEPEPEWEPKTVAIATAEDVPGWWLVRLGNEWRDSHGHVMQDGLVTDVRPLVVIDPAAVDVDALVGLAEGNAALKFAMRTETTRDVVVRVLGGLGIEAS